MQLPMDQYGLEKERLLQEFNRIRTFSIDMAEIPVCAASVLAGQSLQQAWTKGDLTLLPVAIYRNNRFLLIALHKERLHPGDTLLVFGQLSSIQELKRLAAPTSAYG
ncbi:TrkA C-terminal domain-containing protein [Propionispora hippei]|uniref:TrkA-C domain-containing protein n=1 Tax=Propionispora hippei DSM 15287 TaxID=1123003 RepID=A0A1M6MBQ0_9FIRM|nr:TrkA C-terminal domain-containing protein [Propionispora hippei]SHJ80922.1 TrkA-C domain-containing protein [Propionispora hippei DSM 15287]